MKKGNIFITGSTGFIGSQLTKKLINDNNTIITLVRNPINSQVINLRPVCGSLLEPESYRSKMKSCEIVFHCAGLISFNKRDYEKASLVNVQGTRNILEAAYQTGVKKVVHLSACAVLGFSRNNNVLIDENSNPSIKKDNVYAYTKKLAEDVVQEYVEKGMDISIANIATVYGPGDKKLNSGTIIRSIYYRKMKLAPPGGTSFVSVNDLINGLVLLSTKGRSGERYIFCSENMEYKTLVQRIARALQVKEPKHTLPGLTYYPALLAVKGIELLYSSLHKELNLISPQILKEVYGYKYFNSEKARIELGWEPSQSLEETVKIAFDYYKKNNLI
jgi:dihydroflavonol-4-reductase